MNLGPFSRAEQFQGQESVCAQGTLTRLSQRLTRAKLLRFSLT
jgi:hypothetical protein